MYVGGWENHPNSCVTDGDFAAIGDPIGDIYTQYILSGVAGNKKSRDSLIVLNRDEFRGTRGTTRFAAILQQPLMHTNMCDAG